MNKKTLYIVGPKISKNAPDGGQVRIFYISKALENIYSNYKYIDPASFQNYKSLIKFALKDKNVRSFLIANDKKYIASNGYPINKKVINFISKIATLLYFDYHDDPKIQFKDLEIKISNREVNEINDNLYTNLDKFNHIGLSSPGLNNFAKIKTSKIINATNASDPNHFKASKLPGTKTVGLIGSTSPGRGAEMLIKSCMKLRKEIPKLKLRLALNNIDGRGDLDKLIKKYSKESWINFENINYKEAPKFISKCDVCVIPHKKTLYTNTVLPIKLFDYMASSRPIVATNCTAMASLIRKYNTGIVCEYNQNDISKSIKKLLSDSTLATKLGENGRRIVVKDFNWPKTASNIISKLKLSK